MSFKPDKVVLVQSRLMAQQGNPADVLQPPLISSLGVEESASLEIQMGK